MMKKRFGCRLGLTIAAVALVAPLLSVVTFAGATAGASVSYTAYVGNDQCPTDNSVSSVTGPTWTVGSTIGVGDCPAGVAFSPNGTTAYIANASDNTITPIATSTFTAGTAFSSGVSSPLYMAVTPNGQFLIATGNGSNNIAIISTSDTADVQTVTVGSGPTGIAVLPNSSAAYVANGGDGTVSVVSLTGTPAVTKTISFKTTKKAGCASPNGIAATPNGKDVYVSCYAGEVYKIVVKTNKAAGKPIEVPQTSGNQQIVISPSGSTAYVSNYNGYVYPITLSGKGSVGTGIPAANAWGLAISPDGAYVMAGDGYCCNSDTPLYVISTSSNTVTSTVDTGSNYTHRWLAFKP